MMRRLISDCAPVRTSNGIVKVVREAVVSNVGSTATLQQPIYSLQAYWALVGF